MEDSQSISDQAGEVVQKGDRSQARGLLNEFVLREPDSAKAWRLLSKVEDEREKNMFTKKYFGFFLMGVGGISGALVILMNFISRGQTGLLLFLLVSAVVCVALGSILAFTQMLDRTIQPVVEEIDKDVQDDRENKGGRSASRVGGRQGSHARAAGEKGMAGL